MKIREIFERIWRTFIIIFNTIMNLFFVTFTLVCLFDKYTMGNSQEQIATAVSMVLIVNLIDYITRKHFKNY